MMNKIAMITGASGGLASALASITGQVLPVDGGFTAVRPLQKAV